MVRTTTVALAYVALTGVNAAMLGTAEDYDSGAVHAQIMSIKMVSQQSCSRR